jgi:hypothetical protein
MDWTCSKNGSRKDSLRKYLKVNQRQKEEGEDID